MPRLTGIVIIHRLWGFALQRWATTLSSDQMATWIQCWASVELHVCRMWSVQPASDLRLKTSSGWCECHPPTQLVNAWDHTWHQKSMQNCTTKALVLDFSSMRRMCREHMACAAVETSATVLPFNNIYTVLSICPNITIVLVDCLFFSSKHVWVTFHYELKEMYGPFRFLLAFVCIFCKIHYQSK